MKPVSKANQIRFLILIKNIEVHSISSMVLYNTDVIHTVGPDCAKQGQRPDLLRSSYSACLELMSKNKLRSIAFPCISTGKYKYPSEAACQGKGTTLARYLEVFLTGRVKLIANLAC